MSYNLNIISGAKVTASGTYAEDEIVMPQQKGRMLPAIVGIEIVHPQLGQLDNKYSKWHISTKSQDDILDLDDSDCIEYGERHGDLTTSGEFVEDVVERITFPAPILISSAKLFVGVKQDSGGAHTYKYRLLTVPRPSSVQQQNNISQNVQY